MKNKYSKILLLFSLIVLSFSCSKKWKKTSETTINVQFETISNSLTWIEINQGNFMLNNLLFDGVRVHGEDVIFEDHFENSTLYISNTKTPISVYDIPQGTYNKIKVELSYESVDNNNSIEVNGYYKNSAKSSKIPFQLFIKKPFKSEALSLETNEIVSEINSEALITLNIIDWFSLVPLSFFEKAERRTINGISTISISEDFNPNIYTLILEKIGKNDKLMIQ